MAGPGSDPNPPARESMTGAPGADGSRVPMALVLAVAFLLRLWHLGARSIWTDEGSTWTAASSPLPELLRLCAQKDASPPLFYLLTAGALRLGDDETRLRLVSLLASVGLVWLTYRLARLALPRGRSTLAAAICALSPFQLMYAQEARTYTLVAFLTVAALYLFARAVLLGRRRAWLPFVLVSAAALYTQSIALLGVGVQGALVLFTREGRRRLLPWAGAQGIALLLYAPWLFVSLAQASRMHSSHWYLQSPGQHELFQVIRSVFLSPIPLVSPHPGAPLPGLGAFLPAPLAQGLLLLLPAVPLAAALFALRGPSREAWLARFAWAGLVLPLAAVWLASYRVPLWLPRYFVFLTPLLAVLMAIGLARLRPSALRLGWTALVLLGSAYACFRYDTDFTKEPWREAVATIVHDSPPGRTAALVPFDLDPFRYYNRRHPGVVAAFEVSHPEVPFASDYTAEQLAWMEQRAREQTAGFGEVWVVVRSPNSDIRRELAARARAVAAAGREKVFEQKLDSTGGPVRIERWRRAGSGAGAESAPPAN